MDHETNSTSTTKIEPLKSVVVEDKGSVKSAEALSEPLLTDSSKQEENEACLQHKNSLLKTLPKTSLRRGCSDGSTVSVEGFCPEKIDGLFLRFRNKTLEDKYEEWILTNSRWWMYAVLLFQSICEVFFSIMNVFTYFELSGEFQKDSVPQNEKLHSTLSIVFHIIAAVIFLLLSLFLWNA